MQIQSLTDILNKQNNENTKHIAEKFTPTKKRKNLYPIYPQLTAEKPIINVTVDLCRMS